MTDPDTFPSEEEDPVYLPQPTVNLNDAQAQAYLNMVVANVTSIIKSAPSGTSNCTICKNALAAAKSAALTVPSLLPTAMVDLCKTHKFHANETFEEDFLFTTFGAIWTQVLAYADVEGLDGN